MYNDLVKFPKAVANYYIRLNAPVSTPYQKAKKKLCLDQLAQATLVSKK